jgi:saccharopine dehydrogenase-like NADP-dependent oxidoreductase
MFTVAIVGAGRVGTALAKILLSTSDFRIVLIDADQLSLKRVEQELSMTERSEIQIAMDPTPPVQCVLLDHPIELTSVLKSFQPTVVAACVPYFATVEVAKSALAVGADYVDFTEDVDVTKSILELKAEISAKGLTFVPQTGLAPGLVSYIGLSLFSELDDPVSLHLRVGALPRVSRDVHKYAITWSVEGLINEYIRPCEAKYHDAPVSLNPLELLETIVVDGVEYEAFTTSGGVGLLSAYDAVSTVEYKTIRYKGHLDFLKKVFGEQLCSAGFSDAVLTAKSIFNRTRDDVVILVAEARDRSGMTASTAIRFYPSLDLNLTALELTTAGTGAAIIELIGRKVLPAGIIDASHVSYEALLSTAAINLILNNGD